MNQDYSKDFEIVDGVLKTYLGNNKEVVIPDGVTSIGDWAFNCRSDLMSVTIPEGVTSIGAHAFETCSRLTSITIPNSVTSIDWHAFEGCTGLTSITIPESVTSIGGSAFYGCTGLTSITIPDSVTSIGDSAFEDCKSLTSITIPESVTSIDSDAFKGCTGLTSITIPDGITSIGHNAFEGCKGLTAVYITDIKAWCNISFDSYSSNPLEYAKNLYINNELVTDLVIPNGVTSIRKYAFGGCKGLMSITIPNSVTSIGDGAFRNCSGLTGITIPDSVISIGQEAFSGCKSLTSITIPESVTYIGIGSFPEDISINGVIQMLTLCNKSDVKGEVAGHEDVFLMLKPYKNEEIKQIMNEAKQWHIKIHNSEGDDYGYGQGSSNEYDVYREIDSNSIVVENGHFAGVQRSSDYYSYNKTGRSDKSVNVALIKYWSGKPLDFGRTGSSFSSDDHKKWDISTFYLCKK